MKKVFAVSLLCLLISGCLTAANRKNLNRLEIGMSKEQVVGIMGTPYMREADTNREWWLYETTYYNGPVKEEFLTPVVFDKDGKLIGWGRNFWTEKEKKFDVKINQTIEQK